MPPTILPQRSVYLVSPAFVIIYGCILWVETQTIYVTIWTLLWRNFSHQSQNMQEVRKYIVIFFQKKNQPCTYIKLNILKTRFEFVEIISFSFDPLLFISIAISWSSLSVLDSMSGVFFLLS